MNKIDEDYLINRWGGVRYDDSHVIKVGLMYFEVTVTGCYRVDVGTEYRHQFRQAEHIASKYHFNLLMQAIGRSPVV